MSGIGVAEKLDMEAFVNLMPMRFVSYRGSRRDVIFRHPYSAYTLHI
jgi:hypothetical protein